MEDGEWNIARGSALMKRHGIINGRIFMILSINAHFTLAQVCVNNLYNCTQVSRTAWNYLITLH